MKALNVVAAFLGGIALGAVAGILFAPEKGTAVKKWMIWQTKSHRK